MGRAESQILVTHSHLTKFGWSGELHHNLHLVTWPILIMKLVNWPTKKLYEISRLSCHDQYFLLMHGDQLRPTFWLTLTNFLFWVHSSTPFDTTSFTPPLPLFSIGDAVLHRLVAHEVWISLEKVWKKCHTLRHFHILECETSAKKWQTSGHFWSTWVYSAQKRKFPLQNRDRISSKNVCDFDSSDLRYVLGNIPNGQVNNQNRSKTGPEFRRKCFLENFLIPVCSHQSSSS